MQTRPILISAMLLMAHATALEIARPFGDGMVLPSGRPFPVWGKADAGSEVRVSFAGKSQVARCAADGNWRVVFPPEAPDGVGRVLTVESGGESLSLGDVLTGEVWLFSGQSNMDFPLGSAVGGKAAAAAAGSHPQVRIFNLTGAPTGSRAYDDATIRRLNRNDHFQGRWQAASPASASEVSAIAWWTATGICQRKGVPVGIVENAVGGSGTEAWLPLETLRSRPDYAPLLGNQWLECDRIGAWARGRAKLNLSGKTQVPHPFQPGFLFESGVRWWSGFPFTGVVWYQGETNAEVADDAWNERLIVDLVSGWRKQLGDPKLPFCLVQLPRIGGKDPLRAHWPQYREVQARAARRLDRTHLVKTMDLGWDSPDVHPPDKEPVARRLVEAIAGRGGETDGNTVPREP